MSMVERTAYLRGMCEYLPLILFGADAPNEDAKPTGLSDLPGGSIVRAF